MNNATSMVSKVSIAFVGLIAILTVAIAPQNAVAQEISDGYFGGGEISDGYFGGGDFSGGYYGGGEVSDGYFGGGYASDGYFGGGEISDGYFGGGYASDGYFGGGEISDGYFGNGYVSDGYFGGGEISDGYFGDGYVYDGYFGSGSVSDGYFGSGSVNDGYFGSGSVSDGYFGSGSVTDGYFGSGSVTDGYFGSGSVTDGYMGSGSITDGYMGSGSITDGYMGSGSITDGYMGGCGTSCYTYSESCACYKQTSAPNTYSQSSSQTPRFTPPSYVPPRSTPIPPSYPPVYPQPPRPQPQPPVYIPQQPNVTNTNINTNTCTNNSCNTNVNNIDNSINGSFNTATVVTANPQPIIQYQIPPVQNQGLYCLISASQNSIQSGQTTYLAWSSSYGATSATLSEAGNVPTTGTYAVRPLTTRMYTLTVYGQNGQTASCNVMVNVNNAAPYVSLSQIPYTGIDFDIMGSAVYWATLLSLAIAGGYLVVYYNGGALSLASAFAGTRSNYSTPEPVILSETIIPQEVQVAEEVIEAPAAEVTPVDAFAHLPVMTDRSTKDSMSIARDGGVPRIVIART